MTLCHIEVSLYASCLSSTTRIAHERLRTTSNCVSTAESAILSWISMLSSTFTKSDRGSSRCHASPGSAIEVWSGACTESWPNVIMACPNVAPREVIFIPMSSILNSLETLDVKLYKTVSGIRVRTGMLHTIVV